MSNINNYEKELRRSVGKESIEAFAKLYFPHYLTNKTCPFHRELYEILFDITNKRGEQAAIAAPRGSAKSSITTLMYLIWAICYKKEEYILLISNTSDLAVTLLSHIKNELETNERLIEDFPEICETGQKPGPERWRKDEIVTRNGVKITALGAEQKVRGRRNNEFRPSLIILDDVEGEANTQSGENREKLEDWFTKAVLNAGDRKTNIVVIGTILHTDSLLAKRTNWLSGWQKKIYKSVIKWAIHQEMWDEWSNILNYRNSYKDKDGKEGADLYYQDNKEKMLEGTEVLWPDREDYYSLMLLKEDRGDSSFNTEKQNAPVDLKKALFNPEKFYYWHDKGKSSWELLDALGQNVNIYGACDPSLGKLGKEGDYSAIVIVAKDKKTNLLYVLEADIAKRQPEELMEMIISYCAMYKCHKFGFESNQFQGIIADEIERRLTDRVYPVPIMVKLTNTSNKIARIQSLQPLVSTGKLIFSKNHQTLLEQLKYFPKGSHDDGPDALEMAVRIALEDNGEEGGTKWLPLDGGDGYIKEMLKDDPSLQADFDKAQEEEKKQYPHTSDPDKKDYGKQYDDTDDGEDD